jgi:hypothetical protein
MNLVLKHCFNGCIFLIELFSFRFFFFVFLDLSGNSLAVGLSWALLLAYSFMFYIGKLHVIPKVVCIFHIHLTFASIIRIVLCHGILD